MAKDDRYIYIDLKIFSYKIKVVNEGWITQNPKHLVCCF